MNDYARQCKRFGLPVWMASLLQSANKLWTDRARRKKVYRNLRSKLMRHEIGWKKGSPGRPTYVYPAEVKMLIRFVFPEDVCDYPDPNHDKVVYITVEDLHRVPVSGS